MKGCSGSSSRTGGVRQTKEALLCACSWGAVLDVGCPPSVSRFISSLHNRFLTSGSTCSPSPETGSWRRRRRPMEERSLCLHQPGKIRFIDGQEAAIVSGNSAAALHSESTEAFCFTAPVCIMINKNINKKNISYNIIII